MVKREINIYCNIWEYDKIKKVIEFRCLPNLKVQNMVKWEKQHKCTYLRFWIYAKLGKIIEMYIRFNLKNLKCD